MEFKIPVRIIQELSKVPGLEEHKFIKDALREAKRYGVQEGDVVEVEDRSVDQTVVESLLKIISSTSGTGIVVLRRQCETYLSLLRDPAGAVITSLPQLPEAIIKYIQSEAKNLLVFEESNGTLLPWLLTSAKYTKAHESYGVYYPACVDISFSAEKTGETINNRFSLYANDLNKETTVSQLLRKKGLFVETPQNFLHYSQEYEKWLTLYSEQGTQLLVHGFGESVGSRSWHRSRIPLTVEGKPTKCVIDTDEKEFVKKYTSTPFRTEDCEDGRRFVPTHPFIQLYDLISHRQVVVHITQTTLYDYDKSLIDKLVLKDTHRNLIDILTTGTEDIMEDIVKGKTGGIIIIATGPPGVGKTLTAEVYSEFVEKPLYVVQSSQLGITPVELEESLQKILQRATKWNAILLIDEADVFIHQRGDNIVQNAVVGVFLRVLEYYRGILFLTSNRRDIIDDAIRSRATAEIEYTLPDENNLKRIIKILIEQFKIDVKDPDLLVEEFVKGFCYMKDKDSPLNGDFIKRFSGRDIKQILKLCNLISRRTSEPITLETIKYVIPFLNVK